MAAHAVSVQYCLYEDWVAHGLGSLRSGFDLRGGCVEGQERSVVDGYLSALFVTSEAASSLAGLEVGYATHALDRPAVFVDGLEVERFSGGSTEVGGAVGLDGDGAEQHSGAFGVGMADSGLIYDVGFGFGGTIDDCRCGSHLCDRSRGGL